MRTYTPSEIALMFEDTDRFVEERDYEELLKERDKYKEESLENYQAYRAVAREATELELQLKRKVKKSIVRWLNFYPNNYVGVHDTKDDAEAHRAYDRLGPAMRVEYEYEVDE